MREILSPIVYEKRTAPCPACEGKGFTKSGTCTTCKGNKTITVEFPDD
ncbi:hypothetical protein [Actinomadura sp. WMMA1423]|nr:hypothetical protein [Actinomadura sp. WMMA1423]